jgi:putative spermidine/putrescine transport system ATP-binding protein
VYVALADGTVVDAQLPSALARTFEPGSQVTVGVEPTKLLVVPAQTS